MTAMCGSATDVKTLASQLIAGAFIVLDCSSVGRCAPGSAKTWLIAFRETPLDADEQSLRIG